MVIVALLLTTTIAGRVLHARDAKRWKAPGRLVDVGSGRRLHLYCTGVGSPTVVLEAGLGDFSEQSWYKVQPGIASFTRVCSYDRAGLGWSAPVSAPPVADEIVRDLHTLLQVADEHPPYLLVGHSQGGAIVRHYAAHYRDQVAGLLLLEGSHEDQKQIEPIPEWVGWMVHVLPVVNALGIDRVVGGLGAHDSIASIALARMTTPAAIQNTVEVFNSLDTFLDQVRRDARPFGDLPLVVISAEIRDPDPGQSEAESQRTQARWYDMQKDLATRATHGRWLIAERSRHHIQWDRPDLVLQTVRELVDAQRASRAVSDTSN